jgi:hypothetical protein
MYNIKLEEYQPTQQDLDYTSEVVGILKIGGTWTIPRSALIYKKTGDRTMRLDNFLIPELAKHMIAADMHYEGVEHFKSVDDLKSAQANDHNAFEACCKRLGITLDDSVLDVGGYR